MGKRARDGVGGSGHRRPRVDLTHAADASAAAEVPGAPDYDSWNRNADPDPADPVQAALAAKARRMQALGPLGEHLAGYGEDDDAEEGDGMGKEPATATEPAPPWTRLVDEKTRHPYFWNRSTGATVWTLAETTEFRGDAASPKDARESGAADVRESDSSMAEKATATPKERALEARDAPPLESELEDALEAATTTAREVSRRETARLVANGVMDASAAGAFLRSRVPAIESAIERVLSVADGPRASAARDGARRDADAEAKIRSTAPEETETAAVERRGATALAGLAASVAAAAARRHRQTAGATRRRRRRRREATEATRRRSRRSREDGDGAGHLEASLARGGGAMARGADGT